MNNFPFLLQCCNKLIPLLLIKQELLPIALILLLYLHLSDQLILIFNFSLDLLHVLGHLTIVSFL